MMYRSISLAWVWVCVVGCDQLGQGLIQTSERPQRAVLQVAVGTRGLQLLSSRPSTAAPLGQRHSGRVLRYTLLDNDGNVVDRGTVPDPREGHAEWVEDGRLKRRDVQHQNAVVTLHLAGSKGLLTLEERIAGAWQALGTLRLDASTLHRNALLADPADLIGEPYYVTEHGPPEASVDILFVPEGFLESELDAFHAEVETVSAALANDVDYGSYWHFFNIVRWDVRSKDSGIDDPTAQREADTAFDVGYGESVRRCTFPNTTKGYGALLDLADRAKADVVVVIANEHEVGGCASNRVIVQTLTGTIYQTLQHELGHSLFSLSDEYDYGNCTRDSLGPNVSASYQLDNLPWREMVNATVLPTPAEPGHADAIGAFEGGAYCLTEIWRPQLTCRMRVHSASFCAVCRRELERYFARMKEARIEICGSESCPHTTAAGIPSEGCPDTWRNDGWCDECLGDDPDCEQDDPPVDDCPETLRNNGTCDECLGDDPDCQQDESGFDDCPESWRNDGVCDLCLVDDPDCQAEPSPECSEEWRDDGWCDPCLDDDPDCSSCPEAARGDGFCDTCIWQDSDCVTCPAERWNDGTCDTCMRGDPDCTD